MVERSLSAFSVAFFGVALTLFLAGEIRDGAV